MIKRALAIAAAFVFLHLHSVIPVLAQPTATEAAAKDPAVPVDFYDGLRAWENDAREVAVSLWLRASEYGDTRAMRRLAVMYAAGLTLPKDDVLSVYYEALADKYDGKSFEAALNKTDPEVAAAIMVALDRFAPRPSPAKPDSVTEQDPVDSLVTAIYVGTDAEVATAIEAVPAMQTAQDSQGWLPIFHAAAAGREFAVRAILEAKSPLRRLSPQGMSVMHFAAMSGSEPVVRALREAGIVALSEGPNGLLPSEAAEKAGFPGLADVLRGLEKEDVRALQEDLQRLGYDVGTADGVLGPRSRAQAAIAANGLRLKDHTITPELQSRLRSIQQISNWGAILERQRVSESGNWFTAMRSFTGPGGKNAAEGQALKVCEDDSDTKKGTCKVMAVLPIGTCVALGRSSDVAEWSKGFPSEAAANEDAIERCKSAGGRDCKVTIDFCAGME